MRDYATLSQLLVLANMESYNAILIEQGKSQAERLQLLNRLAIHKLKSIEDIGRVKLRSWKRNEVKPISSLPPRPLWVFSTSFLSLQGTLRV